MTAVETPIRTTDFERLYSSFPVNRLAWLVTRVSEESAVVPSKRELKARRQFLLHKAREIKDAGYLELAKHMTHQIALANQRIIALQKSVDSRIFDLEDGAPVIIVQEGQERISWVTHADDNKFTADGIKFWRWTARGMWKRDKNISVKVWEAPT